MGGLIVLYLYALATRCDSVLVSTRLRVALLMRLASADACFAAFGATGFMVHLGSAQRKSYQ